MRNTWSKTWTSIKCIDIHCSKKRREQNKHTFFRFAWRIRSSQWKSYYIPIKITLNQSKDNFVAFTSVLLRSIGFCVIVNANTQRFNTRKQEGGVNLHVSFFIGWEIPNMADGVLRNTSIQYLHPRLKCPVVLKCNLMREKRLEISWSFCKLNATKPC